jgi:hypothetical protein
VAKQFADVTQLSKITVDGEPGLDCGVERFGQVNVGTDLHSAANG